MNTVEHASQQSRPVAPKLPGEKNKQQASTDIDEKQRDAPRGIVLSKQQVEGNLQEREDWASLNGWLVGLKTKSPVGDPVDCQLVPVVMYLTGVPKPVRPKAEKHPQPRDERQRDYCGSKATEQPRVIHPSKSRLQRGCQISHKTYSGRV